MDNIRILTASTGMILTNGGSYGTTIYLSVLDKPENWREIPIEEYEEILKAEEDRNIDVLS